MRKVLLLLVTLICAALSGELAGQCREDGSGDSCGQEPLRGGDAFVQTAVLAKKKILSAKVDSVGEMSCDKLDEKYGVCTEEDKGKSPDCMMSAEEIAFEKAYCEDEETAEVEDNKDGNVTDEEAPPLQEDEATSDADKEIILDDFRTNLTTCMNAMTGHNVDDPRRAEELDLIYQAEVLRKAHTLGLITEENIVWAAVLAAQTGAQRIAREQSRNALLETFAKHNMTDAIRDKFVANLNNLAHLCNDSADADALVADETQLMSTDGGPLKAGEAQAAVELAEYVISQCSADALNLEWFFAHAASISDNSYCGTLLDQEIKSTLGEQAVVHDAHIQTVLALHNDENQLGHDYAKHLKHVTDGIITQKEFALTGGEKLRNVLLSDLSKPTRAKLRYLENKNFAKLHGATKRELCAQRDQLKAEQPDHFSVQSDTVYTKMYNCMCKDDEIFLVCQARYHEEAMEEQPHAFKRLQQAAWEEKEASRHSASDNDKLDASSVARANASRAVLPGFCKVPAKGCIEIGEAATGRTPITSKCCLPAAADANVWGSAKCGNPFGLFAMIANPSFSISAHIELYFGWPAVDCSLKLRLRIGVQTSTTGHWTDFMVNFNIFMALDLCLGGVVGDIASALGWAACQNLATIRYYPFIGKLTGSLRLPVINLVVVSAWARFDIGGPVHDVTGAIKNVIRNPDNHAYKVACPCCRGTGMSHVTHWAGSLVAADESSGVNADNDDAKYIEDEEDEKTVNEDEDAERDSADGAENDEVEEDKKIGEGDEVAEKDEEEALLQEESKSLAGGSSGFWRRRRRRRRDRRRRERRRRDRRRRERRRACVRYWAGALASYDESSDDTANSDDAANLGFWRRRRRRRRDRRRYCLTRPCNGNSAREYWRRKMEDARGGFFLKITGEACAAWWCWDIVSWEKRWSSPAIHV